MDFEKFGFETLDVLSNNWREECVFEKKELIIDLLIN